VEEPCAILKLQLGLYDTHVLPMSGVPLPLKSFFIWQTSKTIGVILMNLYAAISTVSFLSSW